MQRWALPHTEQALAEMLARLARHGQPTELPAIIERSTGLVVDRLLAAGHPVVSVHPTAFTPPDPLGAAGAKSDPGDSYKLADYLRTDGHRLRRLQPVDPALRELQALVHSRETTSAPAPPRATSWGRYRHTHWPGPKAMFCKLASDIALAFLADYPTPQPAARLDQARLAAFCRRHAYRGASHPPSCWPGCEQHQFRQPGWPLRCWPSWSPPGVQLLRTLQATIGELEAAVKRRVAQPPGAKLLRALPGVGTINLAQLLAEAGPVLDRVNNAQQAGAECGAVPVTRAWGKTSGVYFRWAAIPRARNALTAFAHNARMQSLWAGRLYGDPRACGKRNPHRNPGIANPVCGFQLLMRSAKRSEPGRLADTATPPWFG